MRGETPAFRKRMQSELLAVAEGILDRQGLRELQARHVAQQAGCSVGTIYNIFGDLDGLVIAANTRTLEALGTELQIAVQAASGGSVRERLMALALTYLGFALKSRLRWQAVFEHQGAAAHAVAPAYRLKQSRLLALLEDVLVDAISDDATRRRTARAMFGAVHGVVALALDNRISDFEQEETVAQVRLLVDMLNRGLETADTGAA